MNIEIIGKQKGITGYDFVGKVVLIDNEPYIIAQVAYDACQLISLDDGNRLLDDHLALEGLDLTKLLTYVQKDSIEDEVNEYRILADDECKLVINLK